MKFLVDAQLPRRLVRRLREAGHEAIHTLDLPLGNRTPDDIINELSIREGYAVVTKDADFVISFHLHRRPSRLLLISTGNIRNSELETLLVSNLETIADNFTHFSFIEINQAAVIFHL
jgi:predicted nuclease of predicted toxin-antitoxin system